MEAQAKEFLSKFSTKKDAITAIEQIILVVNLVGMSELEDDETLHWQDLKTLIEGMEEKITPSVLLCDAAKVMLENKIRLVKQKIEQLADQHEYYMQISVGSGSKATEIIEEKQSKLWELLDKLQGNIT